MVKLSNLNKDYLEDKGLTVWETNVICLVYKKAGVGGNSIPNFTYRPFINVETGEEKYLDADCPPIQILIRENECQLQCWNWVPGPGPGDFDITFDSEDKAIEFILSYYFEKNEYFEARRLYEEQKSAST